MAEPRWEAPIISPSRDMTAWLVWLMARDLAEWHPERRSRLTREEATSLAVFLADHLPEELRTAIPSVQPALKAG